MYILIADVQALTDNAADPEKVRRNVYEVALDYLAVGIDPAKATIIVQSAVPEIAELTMYFLNLVTVSRLQRNPTVKDEMERRGFGEQIPAGFLCYPVNQAADIAAFRATLVPAGADQKPILEVVNEIIARFNRTYHSNVLVKCRAVTSQFSKLPGIDGRAKMSKSLNNAIFLSDPEDVVRAKVKSMFTDPQHLREKDPGRVEGNPVFTYLDAFDPDHPAVEALKAHYQRGGLGDTALKERLAAVLLEFLRPIQARREALAKDMSSLNDVLRSGSARGRHIAAETLAAVRRAMGIVYF